MNDNNYELEEFRKKIMKLDPEYFDGHTNFRELTPEQKLEWLSELVVFVYESRSFKIDHKIQR